MSESMSFVGIDVSKNVLDVHVLSTGEHWQVGNDQAGCASLVERLKPLGKTMLVVMEATNVFWRMAAAALAGDLRRAPTSLRQPCPGPVR